MENNIDSSRLKNDPDLIPLLDKGATLLACLCFAHWVRGFEPIDIGLYFKLSEEEVEDNIALVKQLLPSDVLEAQIQIRAEIKAIQKRTEERSRRWSKDLNLSAKEILARGQNPAHLLRKFREEISTDIPSQIKDLRTKDGPTSINEEAADRSLEGDLQKITRLRNEATNLNQPPAGGATLEPDANKGKGIEKRRKQRRITIRLESGVLEKLQMHIQGSDLDISKTIRSAIRQYLEANTEA
jgi:hypothetical protein